MSGNMDRTVHTIDAALRSPGRVATEAARILMGKHKADYDDYTDCGDAVVIKNVAALKLIPKKLEKTEFKRHTQHPGGLKRSLAKDYSPAELVRKAVRNMLPKNKLRVRMLKRLTIE